MEFLVGKGVIIVEFFEFLERKVHRVDKLRDGNRQLQFFLLDLSLLILPCDAHSGWLRFLTGGSKDEHDLLGFGSILDGRIGDFKSFGVEDLELHLGCLDRN